jgi:enolase-phosphatase E1
VTPTLAERGIRLVLLDIEGTTTPIAFVHDVLFSFARARVADWFLEASDTPEYEDVARRLSIEHVDDRLREDGVPPWKTSTRTEERESLAVYVNWLMDRDRKSPGLKLLQGLIWERGYAAGQLHGEVFPDVPDALRRWRQSGLDVAIYSSGSELAQRRLFASTKYGDLTPLISAYFDTAVGAKVASASYTRIASAMTRQPHEILFVSDVISELEAASAAGLFVYLSVRPGNPPQPATASYPVVTDFGTIG